MKNELNVTMRIELRNPSNYCNDEIILNFSFRGCKKFSKFLKRLTYKLNNNKKFITIGNSTETHTIKVEDIENVSFITEFVKGE